MKHFARVEPTTIQSYGERFKRTATVKRYRTEDGLEHEFTTIGKEGARAGGVIALTPDKKVVICYQFRAGPEQWWFDIPGGGFHEGEDPQVAALRELKEETGYIPGKIEYLGESSREAYNNIMWHYYLATDCVLSPDGRQLDEEEYMQGAEVRLISIEELIAHAKHNQMNDPVAVLMAYDKLRGIENDESN